MAEKLGAATVNVALSPVEKTFPSLTVPCLSSLSILAPSSLISVTPGLVTIIFSLQIPSFRIKVTGPSGAEAKASAMEDEGVSSKVVIVRLYHNTLHYTKSSCHRVSLAFLYKYSVARRTL